MTRARTAPLVVASLGTLYFLATAARDLQPFDSAEFALNAAQLGAGHPPGQPLYLLLSAAAVRLLPFLSPSFTLALLSIFATTVAAALSTHFALTTPNNTGSPRSTLTLATLTGCAAYLLPGVWDMATRAEVYPLATLPLIAAACLALRPQSTTTKSTTTESTTTKSPRLRFAAIGALLGLAASVNPAMAIAAAIAFTPTLLQCAFQPGLAAGLLNCLTLISTGLFGLAPYLLLPILGAHPRDALNWGEPLSGDALIHYLSGRDYRAWQLDAGEFARNCAAAISWLLARGILPWLLLGTIGFAGAPLSRTTKWALPIGATVATVLLALNHPFIASNPDYDGYLLPWIMLSVSGATYAVIGSYHKVGNSGKAARTIPCTAILLLILSGVLTGPSVLPFFSESGWRARGRTTRYLAQSALDEAPRGSILLLESDHLVFSAIYLQAIEHYRPDVTIFNMGWANSSWYWRWLLRRDPSLPEPRLDAPSREARVAAFLADARRKVVAERLRLAGLAGPPCMIGLLAASGDLCSAVSDNHQISIDQISIGERVAAARKLARSDLDFRLVATTGVHLAEDYLKARSDPALPFAILLQSVPSALLSGLRTIAPAQTDSPPPLTRLTEPRALMPAGAVLLRLGDLLAPIHPATAADYYRRADIPEAESALQRLIDSAPQSSLSKRRKSSAVPPLRDEKQTFARFDPASFAVLASHE